MDVLLLFLVFLVHCFSPSSIPASASPCAASESSLLVGRICVRLFVPAGQRVLHAVFRFRRLLFGIFGGCFQAVDHFQAVLPVAPAETRDALCATFFHRCVYFCLRDPPLKNRKFIKSDLSCFSNRICGFLGGFNTWLGLRPAPLCSHCIPAIPPVRCASLEKQHSFSYKHSYLLSQDGLEFNISGAFIWSKIGPWFPVLFIRD